MKAYVGFESRVSETVQDVVASNISIIHKKSHDEGFMCKHLNSEATVRKS